MLPSDRNVSFRSVLKGEMDDLLRDEGLVCADTVAALVQLVADMAHYREEGVSLSPALFLCDCFEQMGKLIPGLHTLRVGGGAISEQLARRILKECAPLAVGGWMIYVDRQASGTTYGVFSSTPVPLSVSCEESLFEGGYPSGFGVMVKRIAENCVEIVG